MIVALPLKMQTNKTYSQLAEVYDAGGVYRFCCHVAVAAEIVQIVNEYHHNDVARQAILDQVGAQATSWKAYVANPGLDEALNSGDGGYRP